MPRGDRTGPRGMGSMSGRGMGFCNGYGQPGFMSSGYGGGGGRGFGGGFGGGRYGQGRGFQGGYAPYQAAPGFIPPTTYSKETEKGYLENEIANIKNHLSALEEQLKSVQDED